MKKFALPVFLLALIAAPVAMHALAKDEPATPEAAVGMKSVAVVSIASYDELLKDLAFLGEISDNAGIDQQLDGMIKIFTQGQGLKGLDTSKPWGVAVMTDDVQFLPMVMLPVKSLKELLATLGPIVGEPEVENGVFKIQAGPQQVYAVEKGGWAFIGQSADALGTTPTDPAKLLALSSQYDIALKLNVQNVPEMYRTMAIDQVKAGLEQGMAQQPDEDEATYEARKKLTENQMEQMVTSINETKELTLGWKIDRDNKLTFIDMRMSAVPGSKTAKQIAQAQDMPSDFSGFIDENAAASLNFVAKMDSQTAAEQLTQLDSLKQNALNQVDKDEKIGDEATKKVVKSIVADLFDALIATLKAGKLDAGVSVGLGEKEFSILAGALVNDPTKVEASVKKLIELAKKDPKFPGVKLDAVKHKSIRFHTMTIPVPAGDDISKVVGDKVEVAIGFGAKHIYLAAGTDNISKVKAAIDKSVSGLGKKYPPARLTLSLGQIMKFASTVAPNPMVGMLAEELAKTPGKDHLIVAVKPAGSDGVISYRVTAEEGVLKLMGQASKMAGGAAGLPGGGPPPGFQN